MKTILKYILVLLFLFWGSLNASAYSIFIDKKGDITPEYIIRNADQLFFTTTKPGLPDGKHVVWMRVVVENTTDKPQFKYIAFDNQFIYKADFYFYEDSLLKHDEFGFGYKAKSKLQVTNIDEFRISVPAKGKKEIFVRIEPKFISVYSYKVKQLGEMIQWKDENYYATFVFVFLVSIFLVLSFFLFRIFPDKSVFLAYVLFQISTILASTGIMGYYRPIAELVNPVQLTEIFMTTSLMTCLYLLRSFFKLKRYFPQADRILFYTSAYIGLSLLPQLFFFSYQSDYFVQHFVFIPGMLVFTSMTFYLVYEKVKYAWPVALAFLISTIASTILNIAYLGYIDLAEWVHLYQLSLVIIIVTLFVITFLQARDRQVVEMAAASLDKLINEKTHLLAKFGSWYMELPSNKLWISDEMYNIYGIEKKDAPDVNEFISKVHEEDKERIIQVWSTLAENREEQRMEYRIMHSDGRIRYISASWVISCDENGVANRATGYVQDITDRVEVEEERKAISDELLVRNQMLEEFSYSVSHNLRSPLANILGLCDMIERKMTEGKLDMTPVKMLTTAAQRMDSIIRDLNSLLNYDKKLNVLRTFLQLDDIAKDAFEIYRDKCTFLNGRITWDFNGMGSLQLIKPYMDNIFQNMFSNSLKYSRPGIPPVIHVSGVLTQDKLRLEFRDNGLGIDLEKNGSKLFGIYQRFNPRAAEGTGLGLYLIKLQVEKMKGTIEVQSKLNAGTTFIITLPV